MKRVILALLVAWMLCALSGCTRTCYHKEISVKKDASGKIIETTETESITQPWREDFPFPYQRIEAPFTNSPNATPKKADPSW
ncbi:TPA: hypothetical protein DDW35_02320 [Candidatus Sumerlaeota bacterium]|jgi:hypothetical protein|nr:hypothetical protein [Candidatus Sumerlaeota bacterium]